MLARSVLAPTGTAMRSVEDCHTNGEPTTQKSGCGSSQSSKRVVNTLADGVAGSLLDPAQHGVNSYDLRGRQNASADLVRQFRGQFANQSVC